jgi:hypothetical protein
VGPVYVYKLGDTGIYKLDETKDLTRRRGTSETISKNESLLVKARSDG